MTPQLQLHQQEEISRSGLALNLIPGVEISTVWENHEIHIVGLNIDITHPLMCEFLAQQTERRNQRAQLIAERLEKAQIPGTGRRATTGAGRCGDARSFCAFPCGVRKSQFNGGCL